MEGGLGEAQTARIPGPAKTTHMCVVHANSHAAVFPLQSRPAVAGRPCRPPFMPDDPPFAEWVRYVLVSTPLHSIEPVINAKLQPICIGIPSI